MKRFMKAAGILAIASAAFAASRLSERELKARFSYDLGPEQIDVSGYPQAQQDNYKVFAEKCDDCHTLARPINSPLVKREDWKRFVTRMHAKVEASSKKGFSVDDQKKIVDFLVFDSKARKIDKKADFEKLSATLKVRFEQLKTERAAAQSKQDKAEVKPAVNENAQPSPRP